ncbi:hypothetical protein GQ53DRAFT_817312 [Thozetella sp. PMI_491]|nr:hypothetical protein GQ53DRAFT_817312 [Thozetella sp. PMI_491]
MAGYEKVARLMALQPEYAIFRRFQQLNIRNLLYLQAEIMHLEEALNLAAMDDAACSDRQFYSRDWWSLSQGDDDSGDCEQWDRFLELREKLEKYNDTFLKVAAMSEYNGPRKYDLEFLRSWFVRPIMGCFPLLGLDKDAWNIEHEQDLVAMKARVAPDVLSKWFTEKFVPRYHHLVGRLYKV